MHAVLNEQAEVLAGKQGISFERALKKIQKEELRTALSDAVDRTDIHKIKKFLGIE
jgi:ABC-type oligopeptide transport system substrate-binding subunit